MQFFFAAFFGVLGLLLFFAPKPKIENAKAAKLSDFQFPRSQESDPTPRIYGTVKTKGVNTIGQCGFKAVPIKKKVKTGLFSSKKQITGYKYHCGLDLAVCLGPGVIYRRMWYGEHLIWAGCLYDGDCVTRFNIDLPELLGGKDKNGGIGGWVTFYCGAFDQPQDPYLQANLTKPEPDDQIPAYPGIAHMVFEDFWWGNSPSIEPVSVEVAYFTNGLGLEFGKYVMPNGLDANPVEVLYDLYVTEWGNLGISDPVFNLDTWRAAAYKVYDENNGVSAEIAHPNSGAELSKEILRQIDGMIYQNPSTGLIELLLMRRDYVIADLPVLGPDQISEISNFTKKLWSDTFNRVRIQYTNRDNNYQPGVAAADDFGSIRFQQRVRSTDVGMPMCYVADLANELAARELSNLNVPLYQAEIKMNRVHAELTPGKAFVLQWPGFSLGGVVMRIRKMGLGTRKSGTITLQVVQDEFASDAVVAAPPVLPTTDSASYGPQDITSPQFFELPYWLAAQYDSVPAAGRTIYATFAKKPGSASLDYTVELNDTPDDVEVLTKAPYTTTAQLVGALGRYDGFSTGTLPALAIKNVSDATALAAGSTALVRTGKGLFLLNGELMAYETATDSGGGTYTLNNVHRALLDTAPVAGLANDVLYFFDGPEGFWDADIPVAAATAYALDRTVVGSSSETSATVVILNPVERSSLPLPPDDVTLGGVRASNLSAAQGDTLNLAWVERNRLSAQIALETDATEAPEAATTYDVELYRGATLVTSALGIAATTEALVVPATATTYAGTLEIWAVRGGHRSFTPALFPINIIGDDALATEEGDARLTEAGDIRVI